MQLESEFMGVQLPQPCWAASGLNSDSEWKVKALGESPERRGDIQGHPSQSSLTRRFSVSASVSLPFNGGNACSWGGQPRTWSMEKPGPAPRSDCNEAILGVVNAQLSLALQVVTPQATKTNKQQTKMHQDSMWGSWSVCGFISLSPSPSTS